ncbi:MAG TPA: CopD family protein [Candidatus Binataceae bacterium]|nr:CopD family protein [Candidatus Binataceae bacterium]
MAWILAFHVFGVILWMGSLLVLSSLLGLVADEVGVSKERFLVAARRLFDFSANGGAMATIGFGIWLIFLDPGVLRQGWLHIKLLLVVVIIVMHARLYRRINALEAEPSGANRREFAMTHGILSALLLAILLLVFLRPFS